MTKEKTKDHTVGAKFGYLLIMSDIESVLLVLQHGVFKYNMQSQCLMWQPKEHKVS